MTTCARYEDDLALYVEGDIPAGDARAIASHLEGCAACSGFLVELRASQRAVKELAAEPMDDGALAVVRTRVASRRAYRPFRLPRGWRWAIAASLVAAAATTLWLAKPTVQTPGAGVETASRPKAAPGPEPRSEPSEIAPARLPEPEPKRSRVTVPSRTPSPRTQPNRNFGLSPEDADQLARAVVAVSRIERVTEEADPAGLAVEPTGYVQVATADPNVAIFWRLETNGGEQ